MSVDFEFWWLLILPFFFGLGWLAARVDIKQVLAEATRLPAAYFKGLNYLISNQTPRAVEAFSEAIESNPDSLELHFALGSLYRRTGEIDRAIHMHLQLLENKELPENQRIAIEAELAQDYLKAGLFDRAEERYKKLSDGRYRQPALRALLEIYVRERDWTQAINTATELERLSGVSFRTEIGQYYCEQAVIARLHKDYAEAHKLLNQALDANKSCVRANVLLGEIEAEIGKHAQAITYWKQIEAQKPEFLGLVAAKMLGSYQANKELDVGFEQLNHYLDQYQSAGVMNALFEVTLRHSGAAKAAKLAHQELIRQPSLNALDQLLQARAIAKEKDNAELQLMQQTVRNALGNRLVYHCHACGFRAKQYHWQCPACNAWESLPPEPSDVANIPLNLKKSTT